MRSARFARTAALVLIVLCATLGEMTYSLVRFEDVIPLMLLCRSELYPQPLLDFVEPLWHLEQVLLKPDIPCHPLLHLLLQHPHLSLLLTLHHTAFLPLSPLLLRLMAHRLLHMVHFHHPALPMDRLQRCVVCHTSALTLMTLALLHQMG